LVFDDTPQQARVALQRHAKPHQGHDELNLGHLRHQTDNRRLAPSGFGAELKSAHAVAVRAGAGMLLSTDVASTGDAHLESSPAAMQIESARELMTELAAAAQKHKAQLPGEGKPEDLMTIQGLQHSLETVQAKGNGMAPVGDGGLGSTVAYADPQLQLSSPSGIAALTPANIMVAAHASTAIAANHDIDLASQANSFHAARTGIGLFTYGKANNSAKPNKETGVRLHAASGKVSSQSQAGPTGLTADKTVTVASVAQSVIAAAKAHMLLTAQGAYIRISGGNIEVHGPGQIAFKASTKELAGPKSTAGPSLRFPNSGVVLSNEQWHSYAAKYRVVDEEVARPGQAYILDLPDGTRYFGETDGDGETIKVGTSEPKDIKLTLLDKDDWGQENINVWHQEMDKNWD
jgi:uncharacterized protein (DUF2345 family)